MNKKSVLVTGSSGRLGGYLSPYLTEKGYDVTNFDIVTPAKDPSGKDITYPYVDGTPFVRGDLTSLGDCMRAIAFSKPDTIVHLGAVRFNTELQPGYSQEYDFRVQDGVHLIQMRDEDEAIKTDVMGTYYLLDAARRLGVKNVVMASSFYVLGLGFRISKTTFKPEYLPIDEEHPCMPEDTYSLAKLIGEETLKSFSRAYGINSVALRLFGVYYPDVQPNPHKFDIDVPQAVTDSEGFTTGDSYQYADARDVVQAIELSIEANLKGFESFFIGTDTVYSEDTADVIKKRWPAYKDIQHQIQGSDGIISLKKAERLLKYKPLHSWRG